MPTSNRFFPSGWMPLSLPEGWRFTGGAPYRPDTVWIDEALLPCRSTVEGVFLPFQAEAAPRLRRGSGMLLMAAALTVTADQTPDQGTLLALAASLGFTQEKFLARTPFLQEVLVHGLTGRSVRDGSGQRAYFLAAPKSLIPCCARIWADGERVMALEDADRLPVAAAHQRSYGLATAPMTADGPGPLTYLGSVHVSDAPSPASRAAIEALRSHGLAVCAAGPLRPYADDPPGRNPIRLTLTPDDMPCLVPDSPDPDDLAAPVLALLAHERDAAARQARAVTLAAAMLLSGLVTLPFWPMALLLPLPSGYAVMAGQRTPRAFRPAWSTLGGLTGIALCAVAAAFLRYALPDGSAAARALILPAMVSVMLLVFRPLSLRASAAAAGLLSAAILLTCFLTGTVPGLFACGAGALAGLAVSRCR